MNWSQHILPNGTIDLIGAFHEMYERTPTRKEQEYLLEIMDKHAPTSRQISTIAIVTAAMVVRYANEY